jgi:CheY-like chemotaxis protein
VREAAASDGALTCVIDGGDASNACCPNDPTKIQAGVCGCGTPDIDSDNDGVLDCHELCPFDPGKTALGVCGCGFADVDTDHEGVLDCNDGCPFDVTRTTPGPCGCGVPDNTPLCLVYEYRFRTARRPTQARATADEPTPEQPTVGTRARDPCVLNAPQTCPTIDRVDSLRGGASFMSGNVMAKRRVSRGSGGGRSLAEPQSRRAASPKMVRLPPRKVRKKRRVEPDKGVRRDRARPASAEMDSNALRELRRRVKELTAANRRKDEFLATLAHELRTPLGPIRCATEMLRIGDSGKSDLGDTIDRQVDHLARVIDGLVHGSGIGRGEHQPSARPKLEGRNGLSSTKTGHLVAVTPSSGRNGSTAETKFHDGIIGLSLQVSRRIIAVDDNRDTVDGLAAMLRTWGHEVHVACDADTAQRIADEVRPDLMMLDLDLPVVDGYQLARRIRKQRWAANTKLVAVSGWDGDTVKLRVKNAGFHHYLLKPIDAESLRTVLKNLHLDGHSGHG